MGSRVLTSSLIKKIDELQTTSKPLNLIFQVIQDLLQEKENMIELSSWVENRLINAFNRLQGATQLVTQMYNSLKSKTNDEESKLSWERRFGQLSSPGCEHFFRVLIVVLDGLKVTTEFVFGRKLLRAAFHWFILDLNFYCILIRETIHEGFERHGSKFSKMMKNLRFFENLLGYLVDVKNRLLDFYDKLNIEGYIFSQSEINLKNEIREKAGNIVMFLTFHQNNVSFQSSGIYTIHFLLQNQRIEHLEQL